MAVRWKPIDWIPFIPAGLYAVGDHGKVKRLAGYSWNPDGTPRRYNKAHNLKEFTNGEYVYVRLSYKGKEVTPLLSRLVAIAFVPNPDPEHKDQVNHINGNTFDNRAVNLEWVTCRENILDARQRAAKKKK